jgi:hypothetical protein
MTDIEKAFYSDGYRLGIEINEPLTQQEKLFEAIRIMYKSVDGLTGMLLEIASDNKKPAACRKGCHWCCHQPVYALEWEMDFLNNYIYNHFDETQIRKITERAGAKKDYISSLKETEIADSKFPCPLLENGTCLAYEARPMACRIYLSLSLQSCLKFYHNPSDQLSVPELLMFPLNCGRWMNEGFKAGIKINGFGSVEFRIEEAVCSPE